MATGGNDFSTMIVAATQTRRSEFLRVEAESISAGNVLCPRDQRALVIALANLIDELAAKDETLRGLHAIWEAADQAARHVQAVAERVAAFEEEVRRGS